MNSETAKATNANALPQQPARPDDPAQPVVAQPIDLKPVAALNKTLEELVKDAIREEVGADEGKIVLTPEEEAFLASRRDPEVVRRLLERRKKAQQSDQERIP